jgi:hypothetical protein
MLENAMHASLRTAITTTVSIPDFPAGTYRRGPSKSFLFIVVANLVGAAIR